MLCSLVEIGVMFDCEIHMHRIHHFTSHKCMIPYLHCWSVVYCVYKHTKEFGQWWVKWTIQTTADHVHVKQQQQLCLLSNDPQWSNYIRNAELVQCLHVETICKLCCADRAPVLANKAGGSQPIMTTIWALTHNSIHAVWNYEHAWIARKKEREKPAVAGNSELLVWAASALTTAWATTTGHLFCLKDQ